LNGKIKEAHIMHVDLPLRKKFKHTLTLRSQSDSIFLKLILEDGTVGYGESLPRKYVTGETPQSVMQDLKNVVERRVLGYEPRDYKEISSFINSIKINGTAARCALELALLDTYGRYFKSPVSAIIGEKKHKPISYSGVIQAGSIPDAIKMSLAFKIFGLHFIKVKVGVGDDISRLKTVRSIAGKGANIRVDANCAWDKDEAIENINRMQRYNISAVEQPVKADDYAALMAVTNSVSEDVIADESLCTVDDARKLAALKACNIFNIRLSKCGGLLNSLKIAEIARQNNIGVQLGCQVGESSLLSAAGWYFANASKDLLFYEGAYGKFLLKEDIAKEDLTIRRGGGLRAVDGPGLGIDVSDKILNKYTIAKECLS